MVRNCWWTMLKSTTFVMDGIRGKSLSFAPGMMTGTLWWDFFWGSESQWIDHEVNMISVVLHPFFVFRDFLLCTLTFCWDEDSDVRTLVKYKRYTTNMMNIVDTPVGSPSTVTTMTGHHCCRRGWNGRPRDNLYSDRNRREWVCGCNVQYITQSFVMYSI